MQVFIETKSGLTLCIIEVDFWDTVLNIKEKIEKYQGIPVSKQTLFFNGKVPLQDDLDIQQCKIVHESRLRLFVSPEYDPTEQSPVPSKSTGEIIKNQDSTVMARRNDDQMLHRLIYQSSLPSNYIEELLNEDWFLMEGSNEDSPVTLESVEEFFGIQNSELVTSEQDVNIQDSLQRKPSPPPLNSFGDFMYGEDKPLSTEHFTNIQSYWFGSRTEDLISNKKQVFETEQYPESKSTEEIINNQELPVRNETEQSPPIKEVINIPDSPAKVKSDKKRPRNLRVMMKPYSREGKAERKFPVEVNESENVEELRKKLEKIQQIKLPAEGYFFIHKQRVLDDEHSFRWNCVAHGDTIEIFPGHVTPDHRPESVSQRFGY